MYLKPKKTKYNKAHKGRINHLPLIQTELSQRLLPSLSGHWHYKLIALEAQRIKASHIYAVTLAIKRLLKREGKLIFRIFPQIPVTKKPAQVRMGKGKGNVEYWMTRVRKGSCLLELYSTNNILATKALKVATSKLPISCQILEKAPSIK